jgi:predicted DNA-binding transcriptional regulator AlpA
VTEENINTEDKQYLNLKDAAFFCGLSRQTLYYYLKSGRGPEAETRAGVRSFSVAVLKAWRAGLRRQRRAGGRP